MARIRTIKPEFFTSEQVAECSPSARLLFVGMWCFCDDGGVHPASLKRLKMEIFPADTLTEKQIEALVSELLNAELLIEYVADDGKAYWQVTGWHHQKIDRPTLRHPQKTDDSTTIRRALDERSPPEGKGRESKGKEGKGKEARVRLDDLSVEHVAEWLKEKNAAGLHVGIDPQIVLDGFRDYCKAKGKTYADYVAAYRNAFTWERFTAKRGTNEAHQRIGGGSYPSGSGTYGRKEPFKRNVETIGVKQ